MNAFYFFFIFFYIFYFFSRNKCDNELKTVSYFKNKTRAHTHTHTRTGSKDNSICFGSLMGWTQQSWSFLGPNSPLFQPIKFCECHSSGWATPTKPPLLSSPVVIFRSKSGAICLCDLCWENGLWKIEHHKFLRLSSFDLQLSSSQVSQGHFCFC